jgi:hypothetical protein
VWVLPNIFLILELIQTKPATMGFLLYIPLLDQVRTYLGFAFLRSSFS